MQVLTRVILGTLLAAYGLAGFAAGDAAAGEGLYATCATCHGADGAGNAALKAPRLNHLEPVYLAAQLQKFRDGVRGGEGASASAMQMAPMAATLADDAAVDNVVAYIGTLEGGVSEATLEGDVTLGGDCYNQF